MRIELDLPDWVEGRRLIILAGMEEVAHRMPGRTWKVKTERCVNCGKCCKDCEHLEFYPPDKYVCGLAKGMGIPYHCLVNDGWPEECNIAWQDLSA